MTSNPKMQITVKILTKLGCLPTSASFTSLARRLFHLRSRMVEWNCRRKSINFTTKIGLQPLPIHYLGSFGDWIIQLHCSIWLDLFYHERSGPLWFQFTRKQRQSWVKQQYHMSVLEVPFNDPLVMIFLHSFLVQPWGFICLTPHFFQLMHLNLSFLTGLFVIKVQEFERPKCFVFQLNRQVAYFPIHHLEWSEAYRWFVSVLAKITIEDTRVQYRILGFRLIIGYLENALKGYIYSPLWAWVTLT